MRWQGSIDFEKAIKIDGKPHGVEHIPTLTLWSDKDIGRVIHTEDNDKVFIAGSSAWIELTPGGVGAHDHNSVYYTEGEIDNFFSGEASGKKEIDYSNVKNKPLTFTPSSHNNTSHSETYITSAGVTFENLQTNGDVGIGINQLAIGSHNHDLVYASKIHTHTESDITNLDKYTKAEVNSALSNKSNSNHIHDDIYFTQTELSSIIDNLSGADLVGATVLSGGVKTTVQGVLEELDARINTLNLNAATFEALNAIGDIGPGVDQLSAGNHTHTGVYEPKLNNPLTNGYILSSTTTGVKSWVGQYSYSLPVATDSVLGGVKQGDNVIIDGNGVISIGEYEPVITKATGFNLALGTTVGTIAAGNHLHTGVYESVITKATGFNLALGTTAGTVNTGVYESVITKATGFNLALGTTAGTVTEGNHTHTESDITDLDKYTKSQVDTKFSQLLVPSTTGLPIDTPGSGTVRFDAAGSKLYIYNGTSWVSTILS